MRSSVGRAVLVVLGVSLLVASAASCRQDMHDQPKYLPLQTSEFFDDGQSSRTPVAGTVARGRLRVDAHLYAGRLGRVAATAGPPRYADSFPFPIDAAALDRGQQRYEIFCTPCHGLAGDGDGMVVRRGFKRPPSFLEPRLVAAPPGYVFDVMTNGFGAMYGYASRIPVEDRWKIAAYLRALQLSQGAETGG